MSTQQALSAALEPRRIAVMIGVDTYEDPLFPRLQHALNDAKTLGSLLEDEQSGGFDEVKIIANEKATRDEVIEELRRLRANLHPEDVVLLYLSSHGTRVPDGDVQRRFLVLHDTRAKDLEGTGLDVSALQSFFATLPPNRKALVLDACFNGDGKSKVRPEYSDLPVIGSALPSTGALASGEAHLYATSAGRPALEDDQLGHGVYTHYLIDALSWSFDKADQDNDGVVTAWEAHDHARWATMSHTAGVQVPEAALRVVGTADLILSGEPSAQERRDDALVYLYGANAALSGASITIDGRPRGALPGTVPVAPGRHQVTVSDADGNIIASGPVTLAAGRPYRAEELTRVLSGPKQSFSIGASVLSVPALNTTLGGAAPGVQLTAINRDNQAPGRGIYTGMHFGLHSGSQPFADEARGRLALNTGLEAGLQHDWRRLRWRLGAAIDGVFIPKKFETAPVGEYALADNLDSVGWWFVGAGASANLGWVASETMTIEANLRPMLSTFDPELDGRPTLRPWMVLGISTSIAL